jgi:hypothetical protein
VSGNGWSLVSGSSKTSAPANSEKVAKIIIGTMANVTSDRMAI